MSISCEIPSETMSICIHGKPVKLGCDNCRMEHRVNSIESQIKLLNNNVEFLNNLFHDYKECSIYQINKLEKSDHVNNEILAKLLTHKNLQIDENRKISKRIDETIELLAKDYCKLENDIIKLDIKFLDLEKLFYDECINKDVKSRKKPHKCPVCDGSGRYKLITAQCLSDIIDCRSCEGKGIIWG